MSFKVSAKVRKKIKKGKNKKIFFLPLSEN